MRQPRLSHGDCLNSRFSTYSQKSSRRWCWAVCSRCLIRPRPWTRRCCDCTRICTLSAEDAKDLFRQVMDQLPPGSADLGEVRIYLTALIDWLNTDPWPQDPRLGGPRLTPAAIERELQLAAVNLPAEL